MNGQLARMPRAGSDPLGLTVVEGRITRDQLWVVMPRRFARPRAREPGALTLMDGGSSSGSKLMGER